MLVLLSPAKKQSFDPQPAEFKGTQPLNKKEVATLVSELKTYRPGQIAKLMSVSDSLANLNHERYQAFNPDRYTLQNAKSAIFALQGDAYQALDVNTLKKTAVEHLQEHLLILSGLYGYLRPLDFIQPYRLEMKTALKNPAGKDLYTFWDQSISHYINKRLAKQKNPTVINLASSEYFKAVDKKALQHPVITIDFKETKNGQLKTIGINAKRARGLMTRYIAEHRIDQPEKLKEFKESNYRFNAKLSSDDKFVFVR